MPITPKPFCRAFLLGADDGAYHLANCLRLRAVRRSDENRVNATLSEPSMSAAGAGYPVRRGFSIPSSAPPRRLHRRSGAGDDELTGAKCQAYSMLLAPHTHSPIGRSSSDGLW